MTNPAVPPRWIIEHYAFDAAGLLTRQFQDVAETDAELAAKLRTLTPTQETAYVFYPEGADPPAPLPNRTIGPDTFRY